MGLKYVETVKSVVLISLIVLSTTLTFSIWTYTPKYKTIEQAPTVEASIADKKEIEAIVKPYKLLFHFEEGLKGTMESDEIDSLISTLKDWKISDLEIADRDFSEEKLDIFLREKNRLTLFYQEVVPISVYSNVLNIDVSSVPEFLFDRIIVEWNSRKSLTNLHFISSKNKTRYSAKVAAANPQTLLSKGLDYEAYTEVNPNQDTRFIAVPENPVEFIRNTSYIAEISPSKFRDALFSDRNAVTRSQVGLNREEYQDDHALMSVNTASKKLQFVHPIAESDDSAIPSELLLNTIGFMNEHGGWTDEFRYSYIDPVRRYVKFQLFVRGLPVFSDTMPTEIEEVWGEDGIFRYARPYYTLDLTHEFKTDTEHLMPGKEMAEILMESKVVDFKAIEEITPGYSMNQDTDLDIFILEPTWYYMINDSWISFSPEHLGGESIGLE